MMKNIYCNYAGLFVFLYHWIQLSSSYMLHPMVEKSRMEHWNHTAISEFRLINRRALSSCIFTTPHHQVKVDSKSKLSDDQFVQVTLSGLEHPSDQDWVAMVSPSSPDVGTCPFIRAMYAQTGDLSDLPLLCHYPVKAQYLKNDPGYLSCKKKGTTGCSATLKFHVINIRTDISFVLFAGGFGTPCTLNRSDPISFANPNAPLYGHLSSIDSTGTSMKLRWVSGDNKPQQVQYGKRKTLVSTVTTFKPENMCGSNAFTPAKDFGWHAPGYIHSAIMTGLKPSSSFTYRYGSKSVGWSKSVKFKTPPAAGASELKFLAYGDMGKAPLDLSIEHYIQPGSVSVVKAMTEEVNSGKVDSIFHIGDISYATGFLVEWEYFLHLITPLASRVTYMTAIGNHERDYGSSGSVYTTPDSGGECGVPYETYFPMPTRGKDKPWYSIEQASVHFTVISTENDWSTTSEQYAWIQKDLASVDRKKTPWIIFTGHRPMYSSYGGLNVDQKFVKTIEPLLYKYKVELVLLGHVHNYERTCAVYENKCLGMPKKDKRGVATYDLTNYTAPVQAVIGMAGFSLDKFPAHADSWSLVRIAKFGYLRVHATKKQMKCEFVVSDTKKVEDSFVLYKK